jgi:arginase
MSIEIIAVPYDSGLRMERMGCGPLRLLEGGLADRLAADGHRVGLSTLETRCRFRVEAAVAVDLQQQVAEAVRAARADGALPLVLSGNCNTAVGTVAALGAGTGVVWFDAHADFNTPETSPSGFFDGMALAITTGRCWRTLVRGVIGFQPVPDDHVVLVGARDFDPGERALLEASHVARVQTEALRPGETAALDAALDALARRVRRVYLHLDLDVHDAEETPANNYLAPDGPSRAQVLDAVERIGSRFEIAAAAFCSYDPSVDPHGRTIDAAIALARTIARLARSGRDHGADGRIAPAIAPPPAR